MTVKTFKVIDHTADVGIIAYGNNIKEVFSHAALALFSLITKTTDIEVQIQHDVAITSTNVESLLVEWLNELIYLFDVEHLLLCRFDIKAISDTQLTATCYGETIDILKHRIKTGVKAATYHMLQIERDGHGYKAQVIFDI